MSKSFRDIVESIIFAGLKPDARSPYGKSSSSFERIRARAERFINGDAPADPFYVTNRTWGQRIRLWTIIAIPILMVGGLIALAMLGYVELRDRGPAEAAMPHVNEKMLPSLEKNYAIQRNHDLEIVEVMVEQSPSGLVKGRVRNRTTREIHHAELIFDLADSHGSRTGAVSVPVASIPAGGTADFRQRIEQPTAVLALIREVHTN